MIITLHQNLAPERKQARKSVTQQAHLKVENIGTAIPPWREKSNCGVVLARDRSAVTKILKFYFKMEFFCTIFAKVYGKLNLV